MAKIAPNRPNLSGYLSNDEKAALEAYIRRGATSGNPISLTCSKTFASRMGTVFD
jgi:hypothetical protein